jgi:membrane associated rhomboid family serine protease/uncharacterized membrane protein YgcG
MPRKKSSTIDNTKRGSGGSGRRQQSESDEDGRRQQQQPWWVEPEPEPQPAMMRNDGDSSVMSSMYVEENEEEIHFVGNKVDEEDDPWQAYERKRDEHKRRRQSQSTNTAETTKNKSSRGKNNNTTRTSSNIDQTTTRKLSSSVVMYWNCDACTYRNRLTTLPLSSSSSSALPTHSTCEICGTIHIHDNNSNDKSHDDLVVDEDKEDNNVHGIEHTLVDEENPSPSWAVAETEGETNRQQQDSHSGGRGAKKNESSSKMISSLKSALRTTSSAFSSSSSSKKSHVRRDGGSGEDDEVEGNVQGRTSSSSIIKAKSKRSSTHRTNSTATELTVQGSMQDLRASSSSKNDDNKRHRSSRRSGKKNGRGDGSSGGGGGGEDTSESTNNTNDAHYDSDPRVTRTNGSAVSSTSSTNAVVPQYTVTELVKYLGATDADVHELPPALERRVRDFKFARSKRLERHGEQKPWGIYGLYAHLSDIRADLEWAEDAAWRRQRNQPYLSWRDFEDARDKGFHNRPWFTYTIIFLCTIMMIVTLGVNGWKFEPLSVNPLIGPSAETLVKCGARDTNLIVNEGQWYRLFTPMILHAGLVHYFLNMLALWSIGGAVEQSHGFASAAVMFIIPAVGGNILSAICLPQYISVGASGGIFGLIGGCLADITLNWNLLFLKTTTDGKSRTRHIMVLLWLGFDVIVNCLLGLTPFVGKCSGHR